MKRASTTPRARLWKHSEVSTMFHLPADTSSIMSEQSKLSVVAGQQKVAVGRQAARAILIDDDGRLVLIKRTKPGQAPYWTAPGGGVDATDVSVEAALHRELAEELGAEASGAAGFSCSARRRTPGSPCSISSWRG